MTRLALVEHLLTDAGSNGVTTSEFLKAGAGSRFGARCQELRDRGLTITCERVRPGEHRYVLTSSLPLSWTWTATKRWHIAATPSWYLSRGSYREAKAA